LVLEDLVEPKEIGGAWARKLSFPQQHAQMTVEKFDSDKKEFFASGYINASGVFIDWHIEKSTHYRIGAKIVTKDYPAVYDLTLNGSLACQDLLEAQRIFVPANAVVRLGECARKWRAQTVVVDGVVRSFNPAESGGANAGVLIVEAENFSGRGEIHLDGQKGVSGARGNDGPNGANGQPGGRAGNGGKMFLQVHNLAFSRVSVSGGAGGIGGEGGEGTAVRECSMRVSEIDRPICYGRNGKNGARGADGARGQDGFVTNGSFLR
jgi:hypothetical protein